MKNISKQAFTLIELVVALSILSIIMVSVFMIFSVSADLNNKIDISRSLQENIKNIEQNIAKDIHLYKIVGVNNDVINTSCSPSIGEKFSRGTKLCLGGVSYYLAKDVSGSWTRVLDYNDCNIQTACVLIKDNGSGELTEVSNSWVKFKSLYFTVSHTPVKKVTIQFEISPGNNKGIKKELIEKNIIIFQTTLSEKLYND